MSILLKLFGDLRKKAKHDIKGSMSLRLNIETSQVERVIDIARKFNIEEDEVCHIFVNGRYSGFTKKVKEGDIVALFPKNMSVLYKWYFSREEDE
ncbi:MAG: MoaD/ThiS family protein [Promethearchaeota archaeon]|jgi:molybdopterin converting factor small subunit